MITTPPPGFVSDDGLSDDEMLSQGMKRGGSGGIRERGGGLEGEKGGVLEGEGEEVFKGLEFSRPSLDVLQNSVPIVPALQVGG